VNPADHFPQVYPELRRLAAAKLAGLDRNQTLDATAALFKNSDH